MKPTDEASIIQTLDQLQREGKAPMPPLLEARQTVALFKCMLALGWDDVHLDAHTQELRRKEPRRRDLDPTQQRLP